MAELGQSERTEGLEHLAYSETKIDRHDSYALASESASVYSTSRISCTRPFSLNFAAVGVRETQSGIASHWRPTAIGLRITNAMSI